MNTGTTKNKTILNISLFILTIVIIVIYFVVVIFMFVGQWGLFAPYTPKVPGNPADVFRPQGDPVPYTPQEIQNNQKLVAQILANINSAS